MPVDEYRMAEPSDFTRSTPPNRTVRITLESVAVAAWLSPWLLIAFGVTPLTWIAVSQGQQSSEVAVFLTIFSVMAVAFHIPLIHLAWKRTRPDATGAEGAQVAGDVDGNRVLVHRGERLRWEPLPQVPAPGWVQTYSMWVHWDGVQWRSYEVARRDPTTAPMPTRWQDTIASKVVLLILIVPLAGLFDLLLLAWITGMANATS